MHQRDKKLRRSVLLIVLAVIFLGAVYLVLQSDGKADEATVTNQTDVMQPKKMVEDKKETAATGTVVTTGNSQYGSMLFDSLGQAIYIWELEDSSTPECYGACAAAWPPVLTDGQPVASGDVQGSMLGTTKRTDGTTQVTYNGHPLYFYANEKPGEVECHNVRTHGGLWWVIQPNGIRAK